MLIIFVLTFIVSPLAIIAFGTDSVAASILPGSYLPTPYVYFTYSLLLVKVATQVVCCLFPTVQEYGVPALMAKEISMGKTRARLGGAALERVVLAWEAQHARETCGTRLGGAVREHDSRAGTHTASRWNHRGDYWGVW